MTREEVFALVQAHLADELDVDPARIDDSTRFKEDLEADSLDLYTLVQELEDSYGVRMSDEQAARHPHRGAGGRVRAVPRGGLMTGSRRPSRPQTPRLGDRAGSRGAER